MRKATPYILGALLLAALIFLFSSKPEKERLPDNRVTLGRNDKIPYGTWVAYRQLKQLFPKADVFVNRDQPGSWDSLSTYDSAQALVIITPRFQATEYDMKRLISFAEHGNEVFISSRYISGAAEKLTGSYTSSYTEQNLIVDGMMVPDTFGVRLEQPVFPSDQAYTFPGGKFDANFYQADTTYAEVLGRDIRGNSDFVRLRAGKGHIYIHLAPIAFSNYFLLHGDNMRYYEQVLSLIRPSIKKIAWDEYYLNKKGGDEDDNNNEKWLSVLFRHKALRAALLTAIIALILYALLEMRRKQRIIPVMAPPRNDSLDFVKTIGRLYYDKADHRNLCRKMGAYFLEHVRNRYKLPTGNLDESFMQLLQFKSGAPEQDIRGIVTFIKYAEDAPAVTADELAHFHSQLESFYQKA